MLRENKVLHHMLCFMISVFIFIGFMQVNVSALEKNEETKKITISGTKKWVDNEDEYKLRPQSTTIKLMTHDKEIDSCTISAKENWKYSFEVPLFDDKGKQIEYKMVEDKVEHYESSYVQPVITIHQPQLDINDDKYTPDNKLDVSLKDDLGINEVNEKTVILIKLTEKQVFVWTLQSLSESQKNVIKEGIKLRPEIKQDEPLFYNGFDTFTMTNKDHETITVSEETVKFSKENVWSQFFKGTYTPSTITVSESSVTNTLVSTPLIPLVPANPEEPSVPWTPIEPSHPIEPEEPSVPWIPIEPSDPIDQEKPSVPWTPIKPSNPIQPEIPDIIVKPIEPKEDEVLADKAKPVNTSDNSSVLLYSLMCGVTVIGILMSRKMKEN